MTKFFEKHKLQLDIALTIVSVLAAVFYWYDFFENDNKWKWLGGLVFGMMSIIKVVDLINGVRRKKLTKDNAE